MAYSPLQPRDRYGRWVSRGGNAAFKRLVGSRKRRRKSSGVKPRTSRASTGRPKGVAGFKQTATPYVRVNKRSQTIGINAGSVVSKNKRVVFGAYARVESTSRNTAVDRYTAKSAAKVLPTGTRRGRAARAFKSNFSVNNPAIRGSKGNVQARLGTSRGAGPTVIVRRGKHKTSQSKSYAGVKKYDGRMLAIAGKKVEKKKKRPQRRKAARRRR